MAWRSSGMSCILGTAAAAALSISFISAWGDPPADVEAPTPIAVDGAGPILAYPAASLQIIFDIPCGTSTTMRRVESPWGLGYYQLRALYTTYTGNQLPVTTDVTNQATWASSDTSVGYFSSPPGFFRGLAGGSTIVTATYAGAKSPEFWIVLPHGVTFPGPAGTGGCEIPNATNDPELGKAIEVVVGALEPIGAWPIGDPPGPPPSWKPTDPWYGFWFTEEGAASGGVGAWKPDGISFYHPGLSPDESPANGGGTGGGLTYLHSNRGNAVVGVDAASVLRLHELVDANGGLVFPPDLSFFDMLAAIWCAWCRNTGCPDGGKACSEDEPMCGVYTNWPQAIWDFASHVGYSQGES